MAYIKYVNPNTKDSHQTAPAYMLTFLRWANRDTANFTDAEFLELRKPMLVINDCVNLSVSSSKSSHIHTATMVMLAGDINYSTAVAPGDYVLINMVDDDEKLFGKGGTPNQPTGDSLYARATNNKPINKRNDGFKGIFKIQSVRRNIQVNSESGIKSYFFQIQAAAFTEFNQVVYFNPYLFDKAEAKGAFATLNIGASDEWNNGVLDKQERTVDLIFKKLIGFLIGQGFDPNYIPQKGEVIRNQNRSFLIPPAAASLINVKSAAKAINAADIFTYYVGIENYASKAPTSATGLNPIATRDGNFIMSKPLSGIAILQPEPWAQVTAWSILQQYSNSLINEMYTTFKLTPEGDIKPCLVFRQKPFTSSNFFKTNPGISKTDFLSLPRWNISTALIESISLGRDDSARVNFVHIIGKSKFQDLKSQVAQQMSLNSFKIDEPDVKRNGLRPIITACDFDFKTGEPNDVGKSPAWNALYFDWVSNGHLKENGTIVCAGIPYAIPVGDNLQLEDTVYHIEAVNHVMAIDMNSGRKSFKTTIQLSFGVDSRTQGSYQPIYPEMEHTDSYTNRKAKVKSGILPGLSDSQDIAGRVLGEELVETEQKAFSVSPKNTTQINPNEGPGPWRPPEDN
jgi:hypothetical protein